MMARDYENMHNLDEMEDREIRDLVREQLAEHTGLDVDDITVMVADGHITMSGRVGTDGERRVAEHVLTDVLGVQDFSNDLVVDSLRRAESPGAADDSAADEAERSGTLLGDVAVSLTDESGHLADGAEDDIAGTSDYQESMENGKTWNPPNSPTPEGIDERGGEAH